MLPLLIKNLNLGNCSVHGWVKSIRKLKNQSFCLINDGSSEKDLQLVIEGKTKIPVGSSISAHGYFNSREFHCLAKNIKVTPSGLDYPLLKNRSNMNQIQKLIHLRPRDAFYAKMLRVRSHLSQGLHDFFKLHDFLQIHTCILSETSCENTQLFSLNFFKKQMHLTSSAQLHLEIFSHFYPRVYTLSPCFRAEKSTGSRHLAEFYMLEVELSFINLDTLIKFVTEMMQFLQKHMATGSDPCNFEFNTPKVITYQDALKIVNDLSLKNEKKLAAHFNAPVFVTHYPSLKKPFYMERKLNVVENFDLLLPHIGEVAGGSMRAQDLKEGEEWYKDLRKYGFAHNGGFGLGIDRLLRYITNASNVRDTCPIPRFSQ